MPSLTVSELSVLVVEPSAFQSRIIAQELRDSGCQTIEEVDSIEKALAHMRLYKPDLVISAMYFSDGDGVQLVSQMRLDERLDDIPYMLISSEWRIHTLEPIRQAGSVAILPKPFRHEDLVKALQATLSFVDPEELELENFEVEDVRVLIVDDSALARKHIRRTIENAGLTDIVEADNGSEALQLINAQPFDLVITDFHMPQMDGSQLTEQIRYHSSQPDVPILVITSESNDTRLECVWQAGVNAICNKPFTADHIRQMIGTLLAEE